MSSRKSFWAFVAAGIGFYVSGTATLIAGALPLEPETDIVLKSFSAIPVSSAEVILAREAKAPPFCTPVKHMGRPKYLVDQAWQFYRRLEKSSPLRVGWCRCAKRCETIDRNAARIEAQAFLANEARVDPSVPPKQRKIFAKRATALFAQRNETVQVFRGCLDETRPPISKSDSNIEKKLKGCVRKLSLAVEWARWCAAFEEKWRKIYKKFVSEFKNGKHNLYRLDFYILSNRAGKLSQSGTWTSNGLTKKQSNSYIKQITDIKVNSFPSESKKNFHQWRTTLEVRNNAPGNGQFLSKPMKCPQEKGAD